MKRFLPIFLALFIILLSVTPVFANQIVRSNIPEPHADQFNFYFASTRYLVHFCFPELYDKFFYYKNFDSDDTGVDGWNYNDGYEWNPYRVQVGLNQNDDTKVLFYFVNQVPDFNVTMRFYVYDIVTGDFITSGSQLINSGATTSYNFQTGTAVQSDGFWVDGITFHNNDMNSLPLLQISWSDTIDYSSDFVQMQTLISATNSYLNSIDSHFLSFDTYLRAHFDISLSDVDDDILLLYTQFVQYRVDFNQEAATIEDQLDEIISLLGGGQTTQSLDPETGFANSVDEYQSEEDSLMHGVDNRVNEMNDLVSSADDHLEGLSDGFILVRNVFNYFIEEQPLPFTLLFFSLVFGLFITIIGKKVA